MQQASRWAATLATAGLAELAAHFLSLTWGFMVLMAAFVFVAVHVTAGMAAATSKVMTTEARLNGHIAATAPAVNLQANGGTIGGNTSVSGNVSANQMLVNGGSGSAQVAVAGSGHFTSNLQVDGTHSATAVQINGGSGAAQLAVAGSGHFTSNLQVDGSAALGALNGQTLPTSTISTVAGGNPTYNQGIETAQSSAINGLISRLQSVGIIA